jgi:hypothetical protein
MKTSSRHVQESKALQRLVVIPKRDMSTFLSDMDDSLSLGSLCLPGAFCADHLNPCFLTRIA